MGIAKLFQYLFYENDFNLQNSHKNLEVKAHSYNSNSKEGAPSVNSPSQADKKV